MGQLPVALSVHKFVNSVGAYAGFAAFVGLALLILLYFAQARETNTLRNRVQELLGRIGELEARVTRLASAAAQPQPVRPVVTAPPFAVAGAAGGGVAAGVGAAASAGAGARLAAIELPPGPPAGVAAPALSAATRVVPAGVAVRAAAARVPVGVASAPADTESTAAPTAAAAPPTTSAPDGPSPATTAGATNGGSHGRISPPPAGVRAAAVSPRPASVPPAARRPRPAGPEEFQFSGPPEHSRAGRIILALLIALLVAAVVVGVVIATGGKSSNNNSKASTTPSERAGRQAATTVTPSTVTVAVLNGTSTAGAAHTTATKLTAAGFREGKVTNAPDQTRTATIVAYIPGARPQALAVARALKLGQASVQAIDSNTRAVACQGLPNCTTSVVVTVGADLAP